MAGAFRNAASRRLPCAGLVNGHVGFEGLYMGVPARLGRTGVTSIVEVPLSTEARILLQKTAGAIEGDIEAMRDLGLL